MAQLDGTIARAGEDARTLGVAASLLALKAKIGGLERPQEVEVTHRLGSPLVDAGDDEMEWSEAAPRVSSCLLDRTTRPTGEESSMAKRTGPVLALKKFEIDEEMRTLLVEGRAPGFMSWLLARMGLDATTTLSCNPTEVSFRQSSLYGQMTAGVAMPAVASVTAGYSKPISWLILGGVFLAFGVFGAGNAVVAGMGGAPLVLGVGLVLAVLCLVKYVLSKTIVLAVETSGGATFGLTFKRSIIEGVAMDVGKAQKAMAVINENVVRSYQRTE